MRDNGITCLACGVFRNELEALAAKGLIDFKVHTLESMLHMEPAKLEKAMDSAIHRYPDNKYLLLYGDCQPHMHEMNDRKNTSKIAGMNCCEILLGKDTYRKLQREKAFIFLPEWALRWREIFTKELGFDKPENAKAFLKEHLDKMVYIDTGITQVPNQVLKEIREFFDMPIEVMSISLDIFKLKIDNALHKFDQDGTV